jgi:hypothetical protein
MFTCVHSVRLHGSATGLGVVILSIAAADDDTDHADQVGDFSNCPDFFGQVAFAGNLSVRVSESVVDRTHLHRMLSHSASTFQLRVIYSTEALDLNRFSIAL